MILGGISLFAHLYTLNIKAKTVGNGQHGTAHWASNREIRQTYAHVPFEPDRWRRGENLPAEQGIVVGCEDKRLSLLSRFWDFCDLIIAILLRKTSPNSRKQRTVALVDTGDVHAVMIGAAGVGKTAYWLYPCIEYALASGMSFLSTDTKGDIARNRF